MTAGRRENRLLAVWPGGDNLDVSFPIGEICYRSGNIPAMQMRKAGVFHSTIDVIEAPQQNRIQPINGG